MSGRLIVTPCNLELETGQPVIQMSELITGFNLAPCRPLSILRQPEQQLTLDQAFWSFTPPWMKQLDQAPYILRSEKLLTSPMFKESWESRRCVIPVTGYYLWLQMKRRKQAFAIRKEHNRPFFLAGLWTRYPVAPGRSYDSFGLISTPATRWLGQLSPRTPLTIDSAQLQVWLNKATPSADCQALLEPCEQGFEFYPVSDLVNNPDNQSSQVASPIADRRKPK
ncbi:Putative SOS response-associated peptidase YedK [Marinospirillum celere]|uniref:Abasic site processing protein n=1 Tax=Marinospirillum celere TaxID=1122252 RepID=A0A1I1JND3_9GAMM|nr:SOS response-associated peptidase [Marinospirillum celere]SFC50097.1 Putative SOS response-associated peptidase YedK [Marinospirillum celere]